MRKILRKRTVLKDSTFVPVIRDGAIATADVADGRPIPVLIVDCSNHKELLNLIYLHESTPAGDVYCTWGKNKKFAFLIFEFQRPAEVKVGVKFDLQSEWRTADGIVQARGVYLQPAESGEKVMDGLDQPKIVVEVSPRTKLKDWDAMLVKAISRSMAKSAVPKKQAKEVARQSLERTREFWRLRMEKGGS